MIDRPALPNGVVTAIANRVRLSTACSPDYLSAVGFVGKQPQ